MLHGSGAGRLVRAARGAAGAERPQRGRGARGSAHRRLAASATLTALLAIGCKKKEKPEPITVPPPGAASSDELTTAIGQARGIHSALAPSSTRWQRAFVLDDKRAVLTGEVENEAIALVTDNAGRTWRSLRRLREGWSTWSVGADGSTVLAVGTRGPDLSKPARGAAMAAPAADPPSLLFAPFEATELSAPSLVTLPEMSRGARQPVNAVPAVLSAESATLLVEPKPRRATLVYAGLPGASTAAPVPLPAQEQALLVPYGRPPALLSMRGRNLLVRPVPEPGKPLDAPRSVDGLVMTPAATAALSTPPACDFGEWSIQLVPQPPDTTAVVAISATQTAVLKLPAKAAPGASVGCAADRVMVEVVSPVTKELTIATCTLDGACVLAEKPPFRPWLEPHERSVALAPTRGGVAAVLTSRTAARWGLYIAQSPEAGKIYDVPRFIGEGTGERGRIELGALLSFGNRLVMLLQADVTGTSRRGWYVAASEDSGLTWSPP
ncbi:hypothetical protein WMF18_37130 [Sorangium sp. So ce315]|uniref:hypothetical protein n=1 Tax=Sorangium sp. So ce315 TaxID=3133299 RepID=UPI003F5F540B